MTSRTTFDGHLVDNVAYYSGADNARAYLANKRYVTNPFSKHADRHRFMSFNLGWNDVMIQACGDVSAS